MKWGTLKENPTRLLVRYQVGAASNLLGLQIETTAPNDLLGSLPTEKYQIGINPQDARAIAHQLLICADHADGKKMDEPNA